jgi:hypothetical protein
MAGNPPWDFNGFAAGRIGKNSKIIRSKVFDKKRSVATFTHIPVRKHPLVSWWRISFSLCRGSKAG